VQPDRIRTGCDGVVDQGSDIERASLTGFIF
jgi:hypothetical protein